MKKICIFLPLLIIYINLSLIDHCLSIDLFIGALKNAPFTVTVRWSKGTKIDAGCGQLAVKN